MPLNEQRKKIQRKYYVKNKEKIEVNYQEVMHAESVAQQLHEACMLVTIDIESEQTI